MTDVVVLRNAEVIAKLRQPREANSSHEAAPCECGQPMREVMITTGGPQGDPALWRSHPMAVDGWACMACGTFRYPRPMSPAQIVEILDAGVEHGRAQRLAHAEQAFLRVIWDWPGYPPAHLNYAEATRSRLHHTAQDLDEETRAALVARMIEHYERAVEQVTESDPAFDRAYITLIEHALGERQLDRAKHFVDRLSLLTNLDDETRARAAEYRAYIDERRDLFDAAAQVVMPHIELVDRPAKPPTPEERVAIDGALRDLEHHIALAPGRWQSAWLYGKALFAAGRPDDGFAAFARSAAQFPDCVEIARDYSQHLLKAERNTEARDVCRSIVAHQPEDAAMLCNLAVCELLCGDVDAATRAV
ncbi:MAG TPA: tetratricopeptide repeat protein, partial [Kofleriaceae bacterium]|nr:tetratricopeptide repeat protein [Kofleriaceae bacterium]